MQEGYFKNLNVSALPWTEWDFSSVPSDLTTEAQTKWLETTLLHPISIKYPPISSYRKAFLKMFIRKVEERGWEVHELALEKYMELLQTDEEYGYRTLFLPNGSTVSLREKASLISCGTTGLRTWQASYLLADFCIENTDVFKGKRILELGAGMGFAGLACVLACEPSAYNFTDCHGKVLEQLTHNVRVNLDLDAVENTCSLASRWKNTNVTVSELDWEDCKDQDLDCDVVLAADVVYDESIIPALVSVIKRALNGGATAYIACTVRNEQTLASFMESLGSLHISCVITPPEKIWFSRNCEFPMTMYHLKNEPRENETKFLV